VLYVILSMVFHFLKVLYFNLFDVLENFRSKKLGSLSFQFKLLILIVGVMNQILRGYC
jgi:hypothetical protein